MYSMTCNGISMVCSRKLVLGYAKDKGFRGRARNNFRLARKRFMKALVNSTYDRFAKRWDFSRLWITVR